MASVVTGARARVGRGATADVTGWPFRPDPRRIGYEVEAQVSADGELKGFVFHQLGVAEPASL
jgi:hypothetical protein